MPYQRKPIEYDYVQYDGTNADAVQEFVNQHASTHYGDSVFKRLSGTALVVAQNAQPNPNPYAAVLYEGSYIVARTSGQWQEVDGVVSSAWFVSSTVDQLEPTPTENSAS